MALLITCICLMILRARRAPSTITLNNPAWIAVTTHSQQGVSKATNKKHGAPPLPWCAKVQKIIWAKTTKPWWIPGNIPQSTENETDAFSVYPLAMVQRHVTKEKLQPAKTIAINIMCLPVRHQKVNKLQRLQHPIPHFLQKPLLP